MKIHSVFLLMSLILPCVSSAQHEHAKKEISSDSTKKSIPKEVHIQIGDAHMMIYYHAPAVRGRVIWGGLVPYGEVWVTGAHAATTLEFNKDIVINSKVISQGKYAIFTIPNKDKWTFILNKKWDQHLADEYDVKDDVLRFDIATESLSKNQERLSYAIAQKSTTSGNLVISWERVKIEVPFQIK